MISAKRPTSWHFVTGRQLKAARALAGISQKRLARETGLHFSTIAYIERATVVRSAPCVVERIIDAMERHGVKMTNNAGPGAHLILDPTFTNIAPAPFYHLNR